MESFLSSVNPDKQSKIIPAITARIYPGISEFFLLNHSR